MRLMTRALFVSLALMMTVSVGLSGCAGNEQKKDPIFETDDQA
jgi:hypothetical protein